MFFFACSMPFFIATEISFALPVPRPTWLTPSPDYNENAETEALTAFDDFADAVDGNYALRKLKAPAAVGFCILLCLFRHYIAPPLELQTGFAGSFRKGFDSAW